MQNFTTSQFYGLKDHGTFMKLIQETVDQVEHKVGIFAGDNMYVYNRNLSFLEDEKFMAAFHAHTSNTAEQSLIWRYATVCWAAKNGKKLDGDFVEIACYKGTTARIVCDYVDMKESSKKYFLYDLFEHDDSMPHHDMPEHGKNLYQQVQERFSDFPNVRVTQGNIPDSLTIAAPEKIAFMHLDINNPEAEIGALDVLFQRMVPGAVLILDDYGWVYYRKQKLLEDPWFEKNGYQVLELPTGQGMVIKHA